MENENFCIKKGLENYRFHTLKFENRYVTLYLHFYETIFSVEKENLAEKRQENQEASDERNERKDAYGGVVSSGG